MMLTIVIGSTVKGILTGLLAGLIARWRRSTALGVAAGLGIGFVLSSLAALGQPDHYVEIVLPGMIVGALVGFVTQWYPQNPQTSGTLQALIVAAGVASLSPTFFNAQGQPAAPSDPLAPAARLEGKWTGTSEGQPGKGTVERTYEREEIFEIAAPGKDFEVYSRTRLARTH